MTPSRIIASLLRLPAALGWTGCAWAVVVLLVAAGVPKCFTSSASPAYRRYASRLMAQDRALSEQVAGKPRDERARLNLLRSLRRQYQLGIGEGLGDRWAAWDEPSPAEERAWRARWSQNEGRPLMARILDTCEELTLEGSTEAVRHEARASRRWALQEMGEWRPAPDSPSAGPAPAPLGPQPVLSPD